MVAIIQPETMPLANIWLTSFFMTLRPISKKATSVLLSKIGSSSVGPTAKARLEPFSNTLR